ncbi:hypothetical protein [Sulfitobacter sp.]|uniref:hypothetical protein n=1 Tax=Sulfitobacter sp. TaxID=1903071 RepID=UPI0030038BD2
MSIKPHSHEQDSNHILSDSLKGKTMVQCNGKFRISLAMAEFLKTSTLPGGAKKLLLGLIYLQEIEDEAWPKVWVDEVGGTAAFKREAMQSHFAYISHLHSLGFAPRSKSSRFLEKPIDDLSNVEGFFDHLSVRSGQKGCIMWKF